MTTTDRRDADDATWPDAVLVDGDWISPSREEQARDLTKSWADAAANAGCPAGFVERMRSFVDVHERNRSAAVAALKPAPGTDSSGLAVLQAVQRVQELAEPGDPDARMDAYYYSFERTGVGIVDAILSAVAQAGKSYHGTDMWSETDEWTPVSHADLIQAAADVAADRIRDAVAGPQRDHGGEGQS